MLWEGGRVSRRRRPRSFYFYIVFVPPPMGKVIPGIIVSKHDWPHRMFRLGTALRLSPPIPKIMNDDPTPEVATKPVAEHNDDFVKSGKPVS